MLSNVYHSLSSVTNPPPQLEDLGEQVTNLESFFVTDLHKHICLQNLAVPCYMTRLHELMQQAGGILSKDIQPNGETCEFICSKKAAHFAAQLQACFVEYGFCEALDTLYDTGEASLRLDALEIKTQCIEKNAQDGSTQNVSNYI